MYKVLEAKDFILNFRGYLTIIHIFNKLITFEK